MATVDVIINPAAGRGQGRKLREPILARIREFGHEARCHETEGVGDGVRLANEVVEAGARTLVVCGGDGTLFEVINGCMQMGGPLPDLVLVPLGRGNDFAKSLGVPRNWRDACDRVELGFRQPVDVGQCNDIFFINGMGVGLDAEVAGFAARNRWLKGDLVYVLGLLRSLIKRPGVSLLVKHDEGYYKQEMTLVGVANGNWLGGRFRLAPHAEIDDGRLDLVVTPRLGRWEILRYAPRVISDQVATIRGYELKRTRRLIIISEQPVPVQADGEVIYSGATHLEISVLPGAVHFLC